MKTSLARLLSFLSFLFFTTISHATDADCSDPNPIRFALIPKKNMIEQLEHYQPLLKILEKKLNRRVEVLIPTSYGNVIEGLLSSTIDIAELGAGSFALTLKRNPQSVEAFATYSHIKGLYTEEGKYYRSILIVKNDDRFNDISALRNKTVNFTDPASTSGSIIPQKLFPAEIGQPIENYFASVLYAGSHEKAANLVHKGFSDAAFVASMRLDEAIETERFSKKDFKVLWASKKIPNEPTVYRSSLCEPLKKIIREVYLSNDATLVPMLRNLNLHKFLRASNADYQEVIEILD